MKKNKISEVNSVEENRDNCESNLSEERYLKSKMIVEWGLGLLLLCTVLWVLAYDKNIFAIVKLLKIIMTIVLVAKIYLGAKWALYTVIGTAIFTILRSIYQFYILSTILPAEDFDLSRPYLHTTIDFSFSLAFLLFFMLNENFLYYFKVKNANRQSKAKQAEE